MFARYFFVVVFFLLFLFDVPQAFSQAYPGVGVRPPVDQSANKENELGANLDFSSVELSRWGLNMDRSTKSYDGFAARAMSGDEKDRLFSIASSLRNLYPQTSYYQPFGQKVIEQMTEYAYIADVSDDPVEANEALKEYRKTLLSHLANIKVVEFAITLSHANRRYGDVMILEDVRNALLKVIRGWNKRGDTAERAYRIVTYSDETYVLSLHNVTIERSEIFQVGDKFYNVHDVVFEDNGSHGRLYTDLTAPIYMYEKTRAFRARENEAMDLRKY
ncbi:MAG: hypothetical protein ACLFU1_08760 [Alphaproteobacteria bacterium]